MIQFAAFLSVSAQQVGDNTMALALCAPLAGLLFAAVIVVVIVVVRRRKPNLPAYESIDDGEPVFEDSDTGGSDLGGWNDSGAGAADDT